MFQKKLFRRKPMSMILIVEKHQVSEDPFENKVDCDEAKKPFKRIKLKRETGSDCERSTTVDRANAIQARLGYEFPSFVKYMLPSHVTGGFWLGLPSQFCRLHLPKADTIITLEDGNGKDFETKYLFAKGGLSGGWRGYSIAHNLVEGDVLVFHLVSPTKFKIYTVKADGSSDQEEGALDLLKPDEYTKEMDSIEIGNDPTQENALNDIPMAKTEIEDHENKVWGGIRLAETVIPFQEVKTIEDFNIVVNGLIINSEFPENVITKYYDLCRREQAYLHESLVEGLYYNLVVAAIKGVTAIADGVESPNAAETGGRQLVTWDTILEGFQVLGMNVGFLRTQIGQLRRDRDGTKIKEEEC